MLLVATNSGTLIIALPDLERALGPRHDSPPDEVQRVDPDIGGQNVAPVVEAIREEIEATP